MINLYQVINVNVDKIEIYNNEKSFIIYPKENKLLKEENIYYIEEKEIEELIKIIRTWKNNYIDNSYNDGVIFYVRVYYEGKRAVPNNYEEFDLYVKRIYDKRQITIN